MGESYSCASGGTVAAGRSVKTAVQRAAELMTAGTSLVVTNTSLNLPGSNGTIPWGPTLAPNALTMLDWANSMPWDAQKKRIYACGGRQVSDPLAQKMVKFDAKQDVWSSFIDPWSGGTGGHMYNDFDYAPQHQLMLYSLYSSNAAICTWNTVTESAGVVIPGPLNTGYGGWSAVSTIAWHPTLGSQGSIVYMNIINNRIMRYDWQSQVWTELKFNGVSGGNSHLIRVYLPALELVVIGSSSGVAAPYPSLNIINNVGAWSITAPLPAPATCNGGTYRGPIVAHPNGRGIILFSNDHQKIYYWDAITDVWHDYGAAPANLIQQTSVACTIPEYGVVLFIDRSHGGNVFVCSLYKPGF